MLAQPLPAPFASQASLHQAFVAGLEQQLAEPSLGAFILVLANAGFDTGIWPQLESRLEASFAALSAEVADRLRSGQRLAYPDDDLMVFLKLMAMGLGAAGGTDLRRVGRWELQYNPLRALRPARASGLKVAGCRPPPFNPEGFHFAKPFLRPEILWQGTLFRHEIRLLYNKFPFASLHTLLVPEPESGLAQLLGQEWHHFAWHLTEALAAAIPGIGLAYNSYGAHASVNHLHFQMFVGDDALPVEDSRWSHNGGGEAYPTPCHVFTSALDAWFFLEGLHRSDIAFNLVFRPGKLYCLPRRTQGSHAPAAWSLGHAWYEMAGGVTAFNRDDFDRLAAADIGAELARLAPPA